MKESNEQHLERFRGEESEGRNDAIILSQKIKEVIKTAHGSIWKNTAKGGRHTFSDGSV